MTPLALALFALTSPLPELELHDHAGLAAELDAIAGTPGGIARKLAVGTSREGRVVEGLELGNPEVAGKPAILLVANLAGPDVFGSTVALEHARRLATGYGEDEAITALLDTTTLLIVPRANPDAAEARFTDPRHERATTGRGVDDDRDGRQGEDPPTDVDGDGAIVMLRVPDPTGDWLVDPNDPRAMIEADPLEGLRGTHRLWTEGRDLDGDERVAEDGEHDTRFNRNFPSGWDELAPDAGLFPGDEPGVRALMELVLGREDLALVLCYGAPDNLVSEPKTVKDDAKSVMRIPPAGTLASDAAVIAKLAERYGELTENEATGDADDAGSFQRWCYDHRGLLTLSAVLWEMPEGWEEPEPEEGEDAEAEEQPDPEPEESAEPEEELPEPSLDAKRLEWIDGSGEAWRFVDWTPFDHPELGPVEIGGFAPFALHDPPRDEWSAIAERELAFLLELGQSLPRVALAECTAHDLGGGLWRIEARLTNGALIPLLSKAAQRSRTIRPARLELALGAGAELVGGRPRELVSELAGGDHHEASWLVRTGDPSTCLVTVHTDHAGGASLVPEVK